MALYKVRQSITPSKVLKQPELYHRKDSQWISPEIAILHVKVQTGIVSQPALVSASDRDMQFTRKNCVEFGLSNSTHS
jgi:hypothetical protein